MYTLLNVRGFPCFVLNRISSASHLNSFRPDHPSYATFSNICLITSARCSSRTTSHFLFLSEWLRYPVGGTDGQSPISHLARSPRFTLTILLSFSSFACDPRIIRRNFSFGLFVNFCP